MADAVDDFFGTAAPEPKVVRRKPVLSTAPVSLPPLKDPQTYRPVGILSPPPKRADLCAECGVWAGQWYKDGAGRNVCMGCAQRLLPEGQRPRVGDRTFMMRRQQLAKACSAGLLMPMAEWVTKTRKFSENKDDSQ